MLEPSFSKYEKIFFFGIIDIMLIFFVAGLFPLDITNASRFGTDYFLVDFYFYLCVAAFALFLMIPFIGKTQAEKSINIPRLILYILILKMCIIAITEFADNYIGYPVFFAGQFDFLYGYKYVHCFVTNNDFQCLVLVGNQLVFGYYPPGVAFIYLFLTAINPVESSLLYRFNMLFFEAGTYYLIYVIAKLPRLNLTERMRTKGVIYSFFAPSFIMAADFFGKYDTLIVFLTLLGIYFFLTDRPYLSAVLWTFCALAKLYTIIWIFGVLIHHLKKRRYHDFIRYSLVCFLTGLIILGIAALFEGFRFFQVLLQFGFQLQGVYPLYVMNVWFFLVYTGLPGINLIPYILMFGSFIYFMYRWKGELTPDFFMRLTAITLFFYPSVASEYLQWLMPMICITMLGSLKKVQVLAALEIAANFVDQTFNFYCIYNGIAIPIVLSPTVLPSLLFVMWRFLTLGLFLLILAMLIIPERFSRYFPETEYVTISTAGNNAN